MTKILGIILLATAGYLFYQNLDPALPRSPAQNLKSKIEGDITSSMVKAGIPKSNGIHHVDIKFRSDNAHEILKASQPIFNTSKDGKVWIEIEILELPDSTSPGLITQTSIFDLKTNNKISEFGQTYSLKKFGLTQKKSVTK